MKTSTKIFLLGSAALATLKIKKAVTFAQNGFEDLKVKVEEAGKERYSEKLQKDEEKISEDELKESVKDYFRNKTGVEASDDMVNKLMKMIQNESTPQTSDEESNTQIKIVKNENENEDK